MDYELEFVPTQEDASYLLEYFDRTDKFFDDAEKAGMLDENGHFCLTRSGIPPEFKKYLNDFGKWNHNFNTYIHEHYPGMNVHEAYRLILQSDAMAEAMDEHYGDIITKRPSRLPAISEFTNTYAMTFLLRLFATDGVPEPVGKEKIITSDYKNIRSIIYKSRKQSVGVYLSNADGIFKSGNLMTKWFIYLIHQAGQQGFSDAFSFSLQEVVDLGMYKSKNSAWEAFNEQFMVMQGGITIAVSKQALTEDAAVNGATHGFFGSHVRKGDIVTVYFTSSFSASMFTEYFTVLPRFAYSLSVRSCLMLTHIMFEARQNYDGLKEGKPYTFTVSIQTLCEYMGLPKIEDVKNSRYRQLIITPFENSVKEILDAQKGNPDCEDYKIDLKVKTITDAGIDDWIGGNLEVTMTGTITNLFVKVATKKAKNKKKIEDAKVKAIAKKAAEKVTPKTDDPSE